MTMDKTGKEGDRVETQPGQNLQVGSTQTSAVEQLTSSIEEGKQYSGTEVKTLAKKMVEDALSADGREQKDRAERAESEVTRLTALGNDLTNKFNTVSGQVAELLKVQNEVEIDKVKDDPAALGSLRARQVNSTEALRLQGVNNQQEARDTEQKERDTALIQKATSINIKLAAMAGGVDEKQLADLVPDGDAGRLANAARLLKQSGVVELDPVTGQPKPSGLTNIPASPVSASGDARSVSEKMLFDAKVKK